MPTTAVSGDDAQDKISATIIITKGDTETVKSRIGSDAIVQHYGAFNAISADITPALFAHLRTYDGIEVVVRDMPVQLQDDVLEWNIDSIDADRVWGGIDGATDTVSGRPAGAGVSVAILDTGIDYTHPDLLPNYRGGYDFAEGDDDPYDYDGHGTHVAGVIAAADTDQGIIGVAPDVAIYALKVFPDFDDTGTYGAIIDALFWCFETHIDSDPSNDIDIISMSLGSVDDPGLEPFFDIVYAAGILMVAAAGNEGPGPDTVIYPAHYDSVIAVAAHDSSGNRALFSSTGPAVELAAPGVSIYSTDVTPSGYNIRQGTSMACPHVTGAAALLLSAYPSLTPDNLRSRMAGTASDAGIPGRDMSFGEGLIDAYAATFSPAPTAAFTMVPAPADTNRMVTFDASGSSDIDGSIAAYVWEFGDGIVGTGAVTTHVYSEAGAYVVNLTIADNDGNEDTLSRVIVIASIGTVDWYFKNDDAAGTNASDRFMDRALITAASDTLTLASGERAVWYSYDQTAVSVGFPEGPWTALLWYTTPGTGFLTLELLVLDEFSTVLSNTAYLSSMLDESLMPRSFAALLDAPAFTAPEGSRIALAITWDGTDDLTLYYNSTTYAAGLASPAGSPGWPLSEPPSLVLLIAALGLAVGMARRSRKTR